MPGLLQLTTVSHGISDNLYRRLQAVQNAAARLITNTRRCEHITPVVQQLHWLPVCQRVQFKIAMLVYKALHNLLPAYLVEDCQLVSVAGHRQLRSSDTDTCSVVTVSLFSRSIGVCRCFHEKVGGRSRFLCLYACTKCHCVVSMTYSLALWA